MKRVLSFVLLAAVTAVAVGCGGSSAPPPGNPPPAAGISDGKNPPATPPAPSRAID